MACTVIIGKKDHLFNIYYSTLYKAYSLQIAIQVYYFKNGKDLVFEKNFYSSKKCGPFFENQANILNINFQLYKAML